MKKVIAVLAGDGIGPEIMRASLPLLEKAAEIGGHEVHLVEGFVGWAAFDIHGDTMPKETWDICHSSDAILFGAVGLPDRNKDAKPEMQPERRALLPLRQQFAMNVNIRPTRVYPQLQHLSPLRDERIGAGINLTFFRELNGGDYFGRRELDPNGKWAEDTCRYERSQVESIARAAFETAQKTGQGVTSIDKANVLGATGTFWRGIVQKLHDDEFSGVPLRHEYVDAFNLYLFTKPSEFQIILTSNAYGDILSDGAAGLAGSMGLLPSASLNRETGFAMYEPSGGSAPDIAGKGIANPIAMILSIALMFRYTFEDNATAALIENAVHKALMQGVRTSDIARKGETATGTVGMVHTVMENMSR